jgi:hypothetical protein
MATLDDLRVVVRTQTETTAAELPNSTIDWYIRQAFERTIAAENTWPSYETDWVATLPAGERAIPIPLDCNRASIRSLSDSSESATRPALRLTMIDHETAEDLYGVNGTAYVVDPFEYSLWGANIYLWPLPSYAEDRTFLLRGNRYPTDWIAAGDNSPVDADPRLHYPLAHYAIALAYAQQEDETLEDVYMKRWQMDVEAARQAIMEPPRQQPMRFGGGLRDFRRSTGFILNTP